MREVQYFNKLVSETAAGEISLIFLNFLFEKVNHYISAFPAISYNFSGIVL
jgi:hypothetical protein